MNPEQIRKVVTLNLACSHRFPACSEVASHGVWKPTEVLRAADAADSDHAGSGGHIHGQICAQPSLGGGKMMSSAAFSL